MVNKIEFKKINLEAKEIFNRYSKKYINMEHNFGIMFVWQEMMDIHYAQIDDALVLCTCSPNYKPFLVQPNHLDKNEPVLPLFMKLKETVESNGDKFSMRGITPDYFNKIKSEGFSEHFFNDTDYAEYVYLQADLAELPGKKYTQKRNHINKLLNENSFEYFAYDDSMETEVINIFDEWALNNSDSQSERNAFMRSLKNRKELNIDGGVILLNNRISAFTLGMPGDDEMYCVLFEKAKNINGLYQLINREFSKTLSKYKYINRQEDMGIEGLRHAKRSYHPIFMIDKYGI